MLDNPRTHLVIEPHLAVHEVILEVDIDGLRSDALGDLGQGQVMGGDQSDRPALEQPA